MYSPKKPMAGFEPTTSRLLGECSTAKLHCFRIYTAHALSIVPGLSFMDREASAVFLKLLSFTGSCRSRWLRPRSTSLDLAALLFHDTVFTIISHLAKTRGTTIKEVATHIKIKPQGIL